MSTICLLCPCSLFRGASVGQNSARNLWHQSQSPGPMVWTSCLSLQLGPGHSTGHMVGSNTLEQSVLCLPGLGSAKILDRTIGLWVLVSLNSPRPPRHFPLPTATVKVQRSKQLHRWEPCVPSCHSPRPSHCRAPTWAPGGQNQSRCNIPAAAAVMQLS